MNDLVAPTQEVSLKNFFQRLASTNPFTDNRVNGPTVRAPDVAGIHQAAFERLTELAREACSEGRGLGAVLWGEAGIGKSHVLARLARWAEQDQQAFLVYLHNLQAAPEYLPRSLLHAVISVLTHGRRHHLVGTPLYRIVYAGILESVGEARYYSWDYLERAFAVLIDRMGRAGNVVVDRSIYEVLFRFFRSASEARQGKEDGRTADLAVRWLSGQALEPAEAHELGLPPPRTRDEAVTLADNQQIKQVLLALSRLAAGRGRPFVLAFDQVDNLDSEQMAALARFLEALIDGAPNLLVVIAGIQSSLLRWRQVGVVQESAWHRLAHTEIQLHRLTGAEAAQIVRRRLDDFLAPYAALPAIQQRLEQDSLFPLGQPWSERWLRERVDVRPRDALNWAREGWRLQQEQLRHLGGAAWLEGWPGTTPIVVNGDGVPLRPEQLRDAIDHAVDERLAAHVAWRQSEPQGLPPDAEHLAGLVYALLATCRDANHLYGIHEVGRVLVRGARPAYQLLVQREPETGGPRSIGFLAVTTGNATSAAGFLRRLREDPRPPSRVLLATDERVGLPLGDKGNEYLHVLEQGGSARFMHLQLTFLEYAELDALETVVGLARSGDLEVETAPGQARAVREAEVIESLQRRGRYLTSRLLREILQGSQP